MQADWCLVVGCFPAKVCTTISIPCLKFIPALFSYGLHTALRFRKCKTLPYDWWTPDSVLACLHVCHHCNAQERYTVVFGKVTDSRQQTARRQLRSESLRSTNSASAAVMCSVPPCHGVTALLTDWLTDRLTEWPFNFILLIFLDLPLLVFPLSLFIFPSQPVVHHYQAVCTPNNVK